MRFWRGAIAAAVLLLLLFCAYLWTLYGQLNTAFTQLEQFVPTRIYSDVSRIAPPQPRAHIETRLKSLAYKIEAPVPGQENAWVFRLHHRDYPEYLVPENHPLDTPLVTLQFDGPAPDALLQAVLIDGKEVPEIFLEPELVATLARPTSTSRDIRDPLKFANIPAPVWKAIIAVEDQHFLEHKGFDPRGLARAIWVNLRTRSLAQGGSTLTQQLVKNLMARRGKNIFRKINELFLSLMLEARFDKEQILERYLNEVYLGQVGSLEIHGVAEGAEHFFGKKIDELNLGEIALMAGLIRGPGFYSPYRYWERAEARQHLVLKKMVETGHIAEAEAQEAMKLPIHLAPPKTVANKAPYFADFVKAELVRQLKDRLTEAEIPEAGFRVYTTLDMTLNLLAQQAVGNGLADLEKRFKLTAPTQKLEGALACVDHTTGAIRALIGGRNYTQSTFNRILNMKRQVGSTFKPFVYLTALAKGIDPSGVPYSPAHPIEDAPWKLTYNKGKLSWAPKNYEDESFGWITYRTALAHSVNTAAAKLGFEVGIKNVVNTARALGVESDLPEVPALSLGVAEMSPVELLRAYATIANHGIQDEITVIRGITHADGSAYARFVYHPKQVVEPALADWLTDMMTSVFTEGTAKFASKIGFTHPAAGKTGTTSNHRDSWFAGFTPKLTTVVWVGLDKPGPLPAEGEEDSNPLKFPLTGATGALPIWVNFMEKALSTDVPMPFPPSPHLVDVLVDRHTGLEAKGGCPAAQTTTDKFIRGREPERSSCDPGYPPSVPETVE